MNGLAVLLRNLDEAGVKIRLQNDRIAYRGPLTPDQVATITRYRGDIIELLELHGDALLPLFRDPARPLTERERMLINQSAEALRRRFRMVRGRVETSAAQSA